MLRAKDFALLFILLLLLDIKDELNAKTENKTKILNIRNFVSSNSPSFPNENHDTQVSQRQSPLTSLAT